VKECRKVCTVTIWQCASCALRQTPAAKPQSMDCLRADPEITSAVGAPRATRRHHVLSLPEARHNDLFPLPCRPGEHTFGIDIADLQRPRLGNPTGSVSRHSEQPGTDVETCEKKVRRILFQIELIRLTM